MSDLQALAADIMESGPTPSPPMVSPMESLANAAVGSVYNPENPSGLHRLINSLVGVENPPQKRLDAAMPQGPKGILGVTQNLASVPQSARVEVIYASGLVERLARQGKKWAVEGKGGTMMTQDQWWGRLQDGLRKGNIQAIRVVDGQGIPLDIARELEHATDAGRSFGPLAQGLGYLMRGR